MEDCFSEGRGFDPESGTLLFVDMKFSNQHHSGFCSGFSWSVESFYVAVCFRKNALILYVKRVSSKFGLNFCMFKGPLEAHVKSRIAQHGYANISREFNDLRGST